MIRDPEKHTPARRFRLPDELWEEFGERAGSRGRSAVLGQLIRWYLHQGPLPNRPAAPMRPQDNGAKP